MSDIKNIFHSISNDIGTVQMFGFGHDVDTIIDYKYYSIYIQ